MSEYLDNDRPRLERAARLKVIIEKLAAGASPQAVKKEFHELIKGADAAEVAALEQSLIEGGMPVEEVQRLCEVHAEVFKAGLERGEKAERMPGHPVHTYMAENREARKRARSLSLASLTGGLEALAAATAGLKPIITHYERKENQLFPFLEKTGFTGPSKVMWGKHDEIREQLKGCIEILRHPELKKQDVDDALELLFIPVLKAVADMTKKERDILFPMAMDVLTQEDWWNVDQQTLDFGFTLYDPQVEWRPEGMAPAGGEGESFTGADGVVRLPSGSFTAKEIMAILNTIPVDMTFVDKHDKVKYFTQGEHRICARSRTIINRDVRLCHPPGSVHIVEKILEDFKSGKASHAPFWIQMRGKFILIEYYALRDENGEYLGTLEVSQDLTHARSLEGEQRILSYSSGKEQP